MKRTLLSAFSVALLVSVTASSLWGQKKAGVLKIQNPDVVMLIEFESGLKVKVTSKGAGLKHGTHFVKSITFYTRDKKHDKGVPD